LTALLPSVRSAVSVPSVAVVESVVIAVIVAPAVNVVSALSEAIARLVARALMVFKRVRHPWHQVWTVLNLPKVRMALRVAKVANSAPHAAP
jgi:hypothetical protein